MEHENLGNKDTKISVDVRLERLTKSFSDSIEKLARSGPGIAYIVGEVPKWKDGDFERSWEMRENDFRRTKAEVEHLGEILDQIRIEFETDALKTKKIE